MRLATLNPKLTWSDFGGHCLAFDCPKCGSPYRIEVHCVIGEPPGTSGWWGITLPDRPSGDGWNGVSVKPSIQNNNHGRKKECGFHCTITDGEVGPCSRLPSTDCVD